MTESTQLLFDEHEIIISAMDIAKENEKLIVKDNARYETNFRLLLSFFKAYADGFHHFKEEEILFPAMSRKNELLEEGVIKEMLDNHEEFRTMTASINDFLNKKDYAHASQQFNLYTEALLDHIAVENDEVFQMAETLFTDDEAEKIYHRFLDCDREIGDEKKKELVNTLEAVKKDLLVQNKV